MELGEIISLRRKQKGLTIDEMSTVSGVPKGTINKIIAGITKDPQLETVRAIARALGCTLDELDDTLAQSCVDQNILTTDEYPVIAKYRRLNDSGKKYIDAQLDFAFMQEQYQADPKKLPHMPDMKSIQADAEAFVEQLKKQSPPTKN